MIAHVEDGLPNVPPRQYRDVIDEANAICAAKRARRSFLLALDFDDPCQPGDIEAAMALRGGKLMVNRRITAFGRAVFVAVITGRGEAICSESADHDTAYAGALLDEFVRADRCKRMPKPVVPACSCGEPAVVRGRCRGCDEDVFYGRDTGNHIGAE